MGFNEVEVGQLIGQFVVDHDAGLVRGSSPNVAVSNGDQRDPRSSQIHQGENQVLQPLFDSQALRKVIDQFTPGGASDLARTETEGTLTANQNNVQVMMDGSDALAAGSIGALTAQHLHRKVLVTGAGATVRGSTRYSQATRR